MPCRNAVDPVDLERAVAQLVVEGLQLLVRALQLLVHRLELLVGALELFVGRLELLDRALQLLVRGLELLARALQLLVGRGQLAVELAEALTQLVPVGDVLEDQVHALRLAVDRERGDADVPAARRAPGGVQATSRISAGSPLAWTAATDPRSSSGRCDSSSSWNRRPTCSGRQAEVALGARVQQHDRAARVEHDLRGGRRAERGLGGAPQRRARPRPPTARVASRPAPVRARGRKMRCGRLTGVNSCDCVSSISALPEQQQAVLVQGEGEALEHLGLGVGGEVHEHVAAGQQDAPARWGRPSAGRGARRSATAAGRSGSAASCRPARSRWRAARAYSGSRAAAV